MRAGWGETTGGRSRRDRKVTLGPEGHKGHATSPLLCPRLPGAPAPPPRHPPFHHRRNRRPARCRRRRGGLPRAVDLAMELGPRFSPSVAMPSALSRRITAMMAISCASVSSCRRIWGRRRRGVGQRRSSSSVRSPLGAVILARAIDDGAAIAIPRILGDMVGPAAERDRLRIGAATRFAAVAPRAIGVGVAIASAGTSSAARQRAGAPLADLFALEPHRARDAVQRARKGGVGQAARRWRPGLR